MSAVASVSRNEGTSCDIKLHSLPCHLEFTGPAKVAGNFIRESAEKESSTEGCVQISEREAATFRGRALDGGRVQLPSDYKVFVLKERPSQGSRRILDIEAKDGSFVCWETDHDVTRSPLVRALKTIPIAEALAAED